MDPILESYQALEQKVAAYTPNLDTARLHDAFTFAYAEHQGQLRKSGEPYIIHPLAVAEIVADLELDVDSVIAAQAPKLSPYREAMRENLAAAMGVPVENVGVKATTTEHLGHEGREEGITAYATCLVCRI